MILTTTETISGRNLATLGLVQGNTIQSKHMFSDMAARMGADAIVCVRYTSASVMQQAAEVLAYGTAVKFI